MSTHDLKYPDVVELLIQCQTDDELTECFDSIVQRVAAKDNTPLDVCRGNILVSLRYVAGYYDGDTHKRIYQAIQKLELNN